ncbi:MAG: SIMPL domain-containing protein [Geminicoccaceae bacterium]
MPTPPFAGLVQTTVLAAGMALAGWWIGDGFVEGRRAERIVTVKGLAEREVVADTALWTLRFVANGDALDAVRTEIGVHEQAVRAFLERHGLGGETVTARTLDVRDLRADPYRSGPIESRFIVAISLSVRTDAVDRVAEAAADLPAFLAEGVVIASEFGPRGTQPVYLFTRLNDFKPELIREATGNAREAASQFAEDSGSKVGAIVRANQGVVQILPRDQAPGIDADSQIDKIVRIVSTLDYRLVD